MTEEERTELKRRIDVMTYWMNNENGIQYRNFVLDSIWWSMDNEGLSWNWSQFDYRIAEKPKTKVIYWRLWITCHGGIEAVGTIFYRHKEEFSVSKVYGNTFHHWESIEVEE